MPPENGATMHIGEVAEQTGLSQRTLRHYDEIGLVTPSVRTAAGYRVYTSDDLARILVIRRMKPLGYSLEEMAAVLDAIAVRRAAGSDDDGRLEEHIAEAERRRTALAGQLAMADEFLEQLHAAAHDDGGKL